MARWGPDDGGYGGEGGEEYVPWQPRDEGLDWGHIHRQNYLGGQESHAAGGRELPQPQLVCRHWMEVRKDQEHLAGYSDYADFRAGKDLSKED